MPEDVGRFNSRKDVATKPLRMLLGRDGVLVSSAEQTITTTVADTVAAPALDVEIGAPLLRISPIVHDQTGRPVEYIVALYRPNRYQIRMDLTWVEEE